MAHPSLKLSRRSSSQLIWDHVCNSVKHAVSWGLSRRTQEAYETALSHNLGALPEPEFTHRFFWGGIETEIHAIDPHAVSGRG